MRVVHPVGSVVVVLCAGRLDDAFIHSLANQFEPILSGDSRYACITDTSNLVELPDARRRKSLADWMNRVDVESRQRVLNVGSSTVVCNTAVRAMLTALYWLWTPPTPQHAARDAGDALDWSIAKLRASNVPLGGEEMEIRARVRMICGGRQTQPPPPPPAL